MINHNTDERHGKAQRVKEGKKTCGNLEMKKKIQFPKLEPNICSKKNICTSIAKRKGFILKSKTKTIAVSSLPYFIFTFSYLLWVKYQNYHQPSNMHTRVY